MWFAINDKRPDEEEARESSDHQTCAACCLDVARPAGDQDLAEHDPHDIYYTRLSEKPKRLNNASLLVAKDSAGAFFMHLLVR